MNNEYLPPLRRTVGVSVVQMPQRPLFFAAKVSRFDARRRRSADGLLARLDGLLEA
jgi:hypothetical protein